MLNKLMERFKEEFVGSQKNEWYPVKDTVYYGRMSDVEIDAMRFRYERAIELCKEEMGEKWILHPSHKVQRIEK